MEITELRDNEISSVFGGLTKEPPRVVHIPQGDALGQNGLRVETTYVRDGDMPLNVTVTSANSDGSFNVRDNNTGQTFSFTPSGG